jgi:hypothetical protein
MLKDIDYLVRIILVEFLQALFYLITHDFDLPPPSFAT